MRNLVRSTLKWFTPHPGLEIPNTFSLIPVTTSYRKMRWNVGICGEKGCLSEVIKRCFIWYRWEIGNTKQQWITKDVIQKIIPFHHIRQYIIKNIYRLFLLNLMGHESFHYYFRQSTRYGATQEQLHLLQLLTGPVMDLMKLNVITGRMIFLCCQYQREIS